MKTFQKLTLLLLFSLFIIPLNLYSQYEYCHDENGPDNPCDDKNLSRYTLGGTHLSKTHLKYFIEGSERVSYEMLKTGFLMAFNTWSNEVPFTCEEVSNENEAFFKIHAATYSEFCSAIGRESFALAFSWPPPMTCNGIILLNAKNFVLDFSITPLPEEPKDLVHTLIHEIGHTFGLCHSDQTSSVMYKQEGYPTRILSQDDKDGIHAIYNAIIAVQNKFENQDNTYSTGGGIVSVDDVDYSTDSFAEKQQRFPFVTGETHKFEAKDQSYNGIQRKFNAYVSFGGGWYNSDGLRLGVAPILNIQVTLGKYTPIYRSKVEVSLIAKTEFNGDSYLNTDGQEFYQYDPITLNFPSVLTIGSNSYKNAGIYKLEKGTLNENGTFTPSGNASVTSLYKVPNKTNTSTAFSNTSQRKFVRTDNGYLHLVYESMNHIWYERSTDNGSIWQIMNGGKNLDQGATQSKLPSIATMYNDIAIVWQEQCGESYQIKLARIDENSVLRYTRTIYYGPEPNEYGYSTELYPPLYSTNADPVVTFNASSTVLVCWKKEIPEDLSSSGIWYKFGEVDINPDGVISDDSRWFQEGMVPGTTINSYTPTVSAANLWADFALAWEERGYYSSIKFAFLNYRVDESGDDNPGFYIYNISQQTVSDYSYYQKHYKPSLALVNPNSGGGKLELSWVGERTYYENGVQKVQRNALYKRDTYSSSTNTWSWGGTLSLGSSTVTAVNVNTTNIDGLVGWNEGGVTNRYARTSNLYSTKTFNTTGVSLQVNNSADFNSMYALVYNNNTLPYSFTKSNSVATIGKTGTSANSSRIAIARLDSAVFYISSSRLSLDGKQLGFISKRDSIKPYDAESLSEVLSTEAFTPEANSTISYLLEYGTLDTLYSMKALSKGGVIQCRLELQDTDNVNTLRVLERFSLDKLTMKGVDGSLRKASGSLEVKKYAGRNLRLKLVIEDGINANWGLMERILAPEESKQIEKITQEKVSDYALSQNYPNPFNPSTVINYQIPNISKVLIKVYDMLGKEIATLVDEVKGEGKYSVEFNASALPSGTYIYEIRANGFVKSGKMILLK